MKDLLLKLLAGTPKSKLDKKELRNAYNLIKAGILKDNEKLKLDGSLIVGIYLQPKVLKKGKKNGGYLQPLGTKGNDFLVPDGDTLNAAHHDLVIAKKLGQKRGRAAAKIIYIAEESNEYLIGYIVYDKRRAVLHDINTAMPVNINTKQKSLKELPENAVVAVDQQSGEVAEILGVLTDPKVDEPIVLSRYHRADLFTADQILEAKSLPKTVDKSLYPDRVDLTHLPFITIDPIDAKDFDDSIYFDTATNTLYVAIADVTEYVTEYSEIDKEAKKRGFSVYLPHKSIPMLPRELSESLCSLQPNVDRLAFTFKITLDNDLCVKHYELFESVIHSVHRYHYDRIDELFENRQLEPIDNAILKWLNPLKDVVIRLREKRLKKGFAFSNPEIKLQLSEKLELVGSKKAVETISHQLIEECMLLANCAAAEYFTFGIFRTHETPDDKNISELLSNIAILGVHIKSDKSVHQMIENIQKEAANLGISEQIDRLIIRSLKRAQYTYDNVGHFGLGFDKYTHFTSPIRRYSDLMLHRLLKAIINKNEKLKLHIVSYLQRLTPQITLLENEVAQIEYQYADRVYARWAHNHIGLTLEGEVFEEPQMGRDIIISITNSLVQGMRTFLPFERKLNFDRFERVKVMIVSAHLATARVIVRLA